MPYLTLLGIAHHQLLARANLHQGAGSRLHSQPCHGLGRLWTLGGFTPPRLICTTTPHSLLRSCTSPTFGSDCLCRRGRHSPAGNEMQHRIVLASWTMWSKKGESAAAFTASDARRIRDWPWPSLRCIASDMAATPRPRTAWPGRSNNGCRGGASSRLNRRISIPCHTNAPVAGAPPLSFTTAARDIDQHAATCNMLGKAQCGTCLWQT